MDTLFPYQEHSRLCLDVRNEKLSQETALFLHGVTPLPGWLLICLLTSGCVLAQGYLGSIHKWQSSAQGWGLLYLAFTERNDPTQELSWKYLFLDLFPKLLSVPPLLVRPLLSPIQLFQQLN